jgi:hypothetical protein
VNPAVPEDHSAGTQPKRKKTFGKAEFTVPEGALHDGERVEAEGRCWAALERDRVPRLALARRQYQLVLTDRRLLLLARSKRQRRRLGTGPDSVALEHDLALLRLEGDRGGVPLRQLLLRLPTGRTLVVEVAPARRELGRAVAARLAPA